MTGSNVLYITNGSSTYMPPLRLGDCQVELGPNMTEETTADGRMRRFLEAGDIPANKVLAGLPKGFQPDLTFIQASSYRCAKPVELDRLPGRKFLVIADLHHGTSPVTSMLSYAQSEWFDGVIVTHGRHFVHWFEELGTCPVSMIPNFNVAGLKSPFQTTREPTILFIGQAGAFHPRRRHLLNAIKMAGLPLVEGQADPEDAARLYGQAQIVFNCSLNGDINMRVFEVLAAGGCLVTDRLSKASGLEEMFENDKHLVLYNDDAELLSHLKRLLSNPLQALTIAENGANEYWSKHSPAVRKRQVLDFVARARRRGPTPAFSDVKLMERAALYERLQEVHRKLTAPTPFMVDPALEMKLGKDAECLPLLEPVAWQEKAPSPCVILASDARDLSQDEGQMLVAYSPPAHQDSRLPPS